MFRPDAPDKLLQALIDIGQELASTIDLDELLNRILRISREVFQFENAIIRLLEQERQVLISVAAYGYAEAAVRQEIRVGQGIMGRVAETGVPILVPDLTLHADYVEGISGARSELAVPLIAKEKVIGVFNVESRQPDAFQPKDIAPLLTMASQAAVAIENARLYDNLRTVSERYQDLHQFNSRILKSVNLGVYTIDDRMRITSWNRRMEEMSGIDETAALGRDLFSLFPILEEEGFADRVRRVLKRGVAEKLRLAHRNHKGELRFQKRRLAPLKDGARTTGAVVIVEDVTEFKRLVEQTIQSEKLAEVGRLSAGIAHEVNNPLAVISYAVQLLLREDSTLYQRDILERVEGEVERLKTLTGGLLSFSRARETVRRETDLNEVVRDVLRLVRFELNRHSIQVSETFGELPFIQADPNKLKQVFINLVLNASQAMAKDGGTLSIRTAAVAGGEVEVSVADSGPGIAAEVREHIFDPFFTTKKDGEGTGLGLYICHTIIAEHEGRIVLETAEGKGTTFRIVLPV